MQGEKGVLGSWEILPTKSLVTKLDSAKFDTSENWTINWMLKCANHMLVSSQEVEQTRTFYKNFTGFHSTALISTNDSMGTKTMTPKQIMLMLTLHIYNVRAKVLLTYKIRSSPVVRCVYSFPTPVSQTGSGDVCLHYPLCSSLVYKQNVHCRGCNADMYESVKLCCMKWNMCIEIRR